MALKFEQLVLLQRRKMIFVLLAYIFTGALAIFMMISLPAYVGILISTFVSLLFALGVGWILTKLVNYFVQAQCPICSSSKLTENFTLQCKMPEYQCSQCQRVYSEKSA
jgi:hypothetical protein